MRQIEAPARGPFFAPVAVLFARRDSIYKTFPDCDVYDFDRNALTWPGGCPVVAHPPCRTWGKLRTFAKATIAEHLLALWAVEQVREWGGVLEHPRGSALWKVAGLPRPGTRDKFGGWTLPVNQFCFGHKAEKATLLYVCGIEPRDCPALPIRFEEPRHGVATDSARGLLEISKNDRERTPPELAKFLVELAKKTGVPHRGRGAG